MRIVAALFLLTYFSTFCSGQKEIDHWFLSYQNRIKVSSNGTVINQPTPSNIWFNESASIADSAGNLLFLSNGFKVFDKTLTPMPAFANTDMTSNFINPKIAPFPGQPSKFYLFYTNTDIGVFTLSYAIIDMSLNGGLGDVISYNNTIDTLVSSMFTLVNKEGTEDFWVVTHRNKTDSFFSRLVNIGGINATPVISKAGMNAIKSEYNFLDLRSSHNGKMIAGFAYTDYTGPFAYTISFTEVFNFNSVTGQLSNKIKTIRSPGYFIGIGQVEFSPDNRLLYLSVSGGATGLQPCGFAASALSQYNLCYTDSVTFTNNSMIIGSTFSFCVFFSWGKMQMGPDKKIYFPYSPSSTLSRLEFPNRLGTSSMINFSSHILTGQTGGSVPKFYHRYVEKAVKNNITYNGGCDPAPTSFKITNDTITNVIWNFGDPSSGAANTSTLIEPQHLFSAPGIYTVNAELFNSLGQLIEVVTEKIEIKDPAKRLLYGYPSDTSFCRGSSLRIGASTINGIFKWTHLYNGIEYSSQIADSITIDGSGTYYIEMLQNDCEGCHMIDSIKVTVLPKPDVNFGNDRNLCTGDSILLNAFNTDADYIWSTGEISSSIWIKQGGTYWVSAEFDNNGCPTKDTITITEVPAVNFTLPNDTTLCNNQTLFLDPGISNSNYFWQDGSSNNNFTVTQPGSYWVRITSQNGCWKSDTIHVNFVNAQNVNLGADTIMCIGDSILLTTAVGGANYLWNTGETTQHITVKNSGTYWIKADNGICVVTDTININFNPRPIISLGNDTILCDRQSLNLTATLPNATYLWQDNSTNNTLWVQQAGLYWTQVTQNGCSSRDSITINYKSLPVLNLGADRNICANETLLLDVTHPSIQSYRWQDNSHQSTFLVNQGGTYDVIVTGSNNCINSDTIVVTSIPLPLFSLGADTTLCETKNFSLNISLNNAVYNWNTGNQTNSIVISQPGIYWLDVIQNGCTKRDSISVNYKPVPIVNIGNDTTLCEGIVKTLNASYPNASYHWQNNATDNTFLVTMPGIYSVSVDLNGCISKDTIRINYDKKPVFSLGDDLFICEGQQLILNPAINNATFLWQDGSTSPTFTINAPGTYKLIATNHCGSNADEVAISKGLCQLIMPNAFTPNGDGNNDIFGVKYPGFIKEFHMTIYNRWGQKVFETKNAYKGWNGITNGIEQPSDNYIWSISYSDLDDKKGFSKGNIILIR